MLNIMSAAISKSKRVVRFNAPYSLIGTREVGSVFTLDLWVAKTGSMSLYSSIEENDYAPVKAVMICNNESAEITIPVKFNITDSVKEDEEPAFVSMDIISNNKQEELLFHVVQKCWLPN